MQPGCEDATVLAMAPRKKAAPEVAQETAGEPVMPAQYRLTMRQVQALRQEAIRRAEQAVISGDSKTIPRPDSSEVLREIIDAWIAKTSKK